MMKTGKAHGKKIQRAPSVTTQSLIARAAGCCRRQRACVISPNPKIYRTTCVRLQQRRASQETPQELFEIK